MDVRGEAAVTPVRRGWSTALVLAGAMFLVLFDSLAVATALPAIGDEFGLSPGRLQWVVTLYSLSIGGFLVLGGRVCDLWGRRRTMVASLALTAVGLLVAGVAPGAGPLLAGRVMQGVGAAFAIPAALASAGTLFPEEPWRSRVFSVVASAANTAGIAGAVGGGLITSLLGWRWLFLIVVPVAVIAVVVALRVLPPDAPGETWRGLDVGGAVLVTGGLVAVIHGAGQVGERGPGAGALLPVLAGLAMLGALVRWERRAAAPLIKPSVVRSRRLTACCLAFAAHSAAYSAVVVVGSLALQERHGLSAAQAGLALAPMLVSALISAVPASALVRRYGTRAVAATALLVCSASLALAGSQADDGPVPVIIVCLAVWGLSGGPIYVALTRSAVVDAAPADRGVASALFESTSHVGGAISVAVFLSMIGAGAGYGGAQLLGAAVSVAGVLALLTIVPPGRSDRGTSAKPGDHAAARADR
ncbi:MFS transporter [Actinoplanes sp. NPDC049802]|uniref:MFS transporter n=1 Tax=Actinoplanes sp. NPDC049802 TaxID=3154742 RepID=UPI00340F2A04